MMCSRHSRNILMSFVVSYLIYWFVTTALSFLGIQGISYLAWILVPILAMWLAYGVSPICFPMIPTCLMEDLINVTKVRLFYFSHIQPQLPVRLPPLDDEFLDITRLGESS